MRDPKINSTFEFIPSLDPPSEVWGRYMGGRLSPRAGVAELILFWRVFVNDDGFAGRLLHIGRQSRG